MKTIKLFLFALVLFSATAIMSCSKDRKVSKVLVDGTWIVNKITIGGTLVKTDSLPTLTFTKCDNYPANCDGTWKSFDGSTADFDWDALEKGSELQLSLGSWVDKYANVTNSPYTDAELECLDFTNAGHYSIDEQTKTKLVLSCPDCRASSTTLNQTLMTGIIIEMSK